jgi:F-type H+-transporting ATPase subunit delta
MITANQYAQALYGAIQETDPKDQDKVLDNFAKVLAERGDLSKFAEIEEEYLKISEHGDGIRNVTVTTAREMPISESLIKELNLVAGERIKIKKEVDPGLIGGIVIRAEDTLLDASIKKDLKDLGKEISGK